VVRYSVHGEMVVRYLVHRRVVQFFVHGEEVAVYVHVREAVEAARDLLPISLTTCCHWQYVNFLWEEEEVAL
jgi:hypothetical protein